MSNPLNLDKRVLKKCESNPPTGFYRDGYCKTGPDDFGTHTVCAKMDAPFLAFTKSRGNNLESVTKPGKHWCLCQDRWLEAYRNGKAPRVKRTATNIKTRGEVARLISNSQKHRKHTTKSHTQKNKNKNKNKKDQRESQYFFYDKSKPDNGYDVYVNKNPLDTIPIRYTTVADVTETIKTLEKLYKNGTRPHKRIWQVAMIMRVRLGVIKKYASTRYPNAKNVAARYRLADRYYQFLKKRTKCRDSQSRKGLVFLL